VNTADSSLFIKFYNVEFGQDGEDDE